MRRKKKNVQIPFGLIAFVFPTDWGSWRQQVDLGPVHTGLGSPFARANVHATPLMLRASCVNTPIDYSVFYYLRMPVARFSASCVNGAQGFESGEDFVESLAGKFWPNPHWTQRNASKRNLLSEWECSHGHKQH